MDIDKKIDAIIKPFMVDSINQALIANGEEPVEKELLMGCSFETLDMILLGQFHIFSFYFSLFGILNFNSY